MQRTDSLEKTLMLGKIEGRGDGDSRGLDGWMASLTWRTWVWVSSRSWWWTGRPDVLQSMGLQRVRHDWATELSRILSVFCFFFSPKQQTAPTTRPGLLVCSMYNACYTWVCAIWWTDMAAVMMPWKPPPCSGSCSCSLWGHLQCPLGAPLCEALQ